MVLIKFEKVADVISHALNSSVDLGYVRVVG